MELEGPDVRRLRADLETLWQAMLDELAEKRPDLPKSERRRAARSRFVQIVDDVVRDVSAG
jgi:hypothetical protein